MKKVLDIIKYILIVLTMILIIIFQNKLYNVFLIISIFCFILGIIHIIEKKNTWILLEIISTSSIVSIILYKTDILNFADTLTFYICLITSTTLIAAVILSFYQTKQVRKIYTKEITATVIDYQKVENTKINYVQPIYSYTINKKEYCVICPAIYKKNIPKIDSERIILLNPKDNEDVYFEPPKLKKIFIITSGIVTSIICIIVIISLFK